MLQLGWMTAILWFCTQESAEMEIRKELFVFQWILPRIFVVEVCLMFFYDSVCVITRWRDNGKEGNLTPLVWYSWPLCSLNLQDLHGDKNSFCVCSYSTCFSVQLHIRLEVSNSPFLGYQKRTSTNTTALTSTSASQASTTLLLWIAIMRNR